MEVHPSGLAKDRTDRLPENRARAIGPTITVITVNLNNAAGLERTLRSIDEQTYCNWRHRVQDGGSYDTSRSVLHRYNDQRRVVVSTKDRGPYDAMNRASTRISTGLVMYLNSGDVLYDHVTLEKIAEVYAKSSFVWAVGEVCSGSKDNIGGSCSWIPRIPLLVASRVRTYPHPGVVWTARLLEQVLPYREDLPLAADQELCIRSARLAKPMSLEFPITVFDASGISSTASGEVTEREFRNLAMAVEFGRATRVARRLQPVLYRLGDLRRQLWASP